MLWCPNVLVVTDAIQNREISRPNAQFKNLPMISSGRFEMPEIDWLTNT